MDNKQDFDLWETECGGKPADTELFRQVADEAYQRIAKAVDEKWIACSGQAPTRLVIAQAVRAAADLIADTYATVYQPVDDDDPAVTAQGYDTVDDYLHDHPEALAFTALRVHIIHCDRPHLFDLPDDSGMMVKQGGNEKSLDVAIRPWWHDLGKEDE